jgi:hypothetical protein
LEFTVSGCSWMRIFIKTSKIIERVVFILIETVLHDAHGSQFTFNCLSHQLIRSYAIWSSPSFCDCIFETSFNTVSSSSLGNKELRLENKVTRSSLELRLRENQTISRWNYTIYDLGTLMLSCLRWKNISVYLVRAWACSSIGNGWTFGRFEAKMSLDETIS